MQRLRTRCTIYTPKNGEQFHRSVFPRAARTNGPDGVRLSPLAERVPRTDPHAKEPVPYPMSRRVFSRDLWVGNSRRGPVPASYVSRVNSSGSDAGTPGVLPENLGGGVGTLLKTLYPIYDQNLLLYLWRGQKFDTPFITAATVSAPAVINRLSNF